MEQRTSGPTAARVATVNEEQVRKYSESLQKDAVTVSVLYDCSINNKSGRTHRNVSGVTSRGRTWKAVEWGRKETLILRYVLLCIF